MAATMEEAITQTAGRLHVALDNGEGQVPQRTTEGSQIVWQHIYGYLRGNLPEPIPDDLMGVATAAGLRIAKGFRHTGSQYGVRGQFNDVADFRPWLGFLFVEKTILNRYRRTVA